MEEVDLRVGCYQTVNIRDNIQEVLALIEQIVSDNQQQQLDLLLFPELFLTGYDCGVEILRNSAITQNSCEIQRISSICVNYNIAICVGYSEKESQAAGDVNIKEGEEKIYNSAILINSLGEIVLNYRKTHLWDPDVVYEKAVFTAGNSLPIATIFIPRTNAIITIGILICFDVEFPEPARVLRLTGASIILVPTAVVDTLPAKCMVPCRAGENLIFIIYSNFTGPCLTSTNNSVFCGLSGIFGPDGRELIRATSSETGLFTSHLIGRNYLEYVSRNNYLIERKEKCHLYSSIGNSDV